MDRHYDYNEKLRGGFTLIELLVVIAVIALLLGILLPALNAVKQKAHAAMCLSNQKQVGVAAGLYASDYNDWIPRGDELGTMIWYHRFLPYVGGDEEDLNLRQVKIYRCGAFPKKGVGYNVDDNGSNVSNSRQIICYVINAWTGLSTAEAPATRMSKFRNPSSKVYIADNEAGVWRPVIEELDPTLAHNITVRNDIYFAGHLPLSSNETSQTDGRRIAAERHSDGCNVLFVDGHADKVKAEEFTERMFTLR